MMLHKFAEWRERVINDSIENEKGNTFNVLVVYSHVNDEYHVCGSVNDSSEVFVSSQRHEKRAFKSLDTLKRLLSSHGINNFVVAE